MTRLAATLALLALAPGFAPATRAAGLDLVAPNPQARTVDQLALSGNACGPAALLNALGAGEARWQQVAVAVPGDSDRARMSYIIRAHGLHASEHLDDRLRWDRKFGINLLDLKDIGNELCAGQILPKLRHEVLVKRGRESDLRLLQRTHAHLAKSLRKGLPPIISLRRMARPAKQAAATPPPWRVVHGHFVVVTALPATLAKGAPAFTFRYIDPWGGRVLEGTIRTDPASGFPSLLAEVPESRIGKKKVKPGETSIITLSAAIGAF